MTSGTETLILYGGLWQYTYGPGENMAKALINTWIRMGGLDFMPTQHKTLN